MKTTISFVAAAAMFLVAQPSMPEEARQFSIVAKEFPTKPELIGTPVVFPHVYHGVAVRGKTPAEDVAYLSLYNSSKNGHLVEYEIEKDRVNTYALPKGALGMKGLIAAQDGYIYGGSQGNGHLYRFNPKTKKLQDIGKPVEEDTFFCHMDQAADGMIYGGTYGSGSFFSFNPATGEMKNYGPMDKDEKYIWSVAATDGDIVFCGMASHSKIYAFNLKTGEKTQIMPEEYVTSDFSYGLIVNGGYLYAGCPYKNIVLAFDAKTYKLLDVVDMSEQGEFSVNSVAFKGDDDDYYFNTSYGLYLWNYNARTRKLRKVFDERFGQILAVFPGYKAYAQNFDSGLVGYDFKTGEITRRELDLKGEGMGIMNIAAGPDGKIYGGTYINQHMFSYDPVSGELKDMGKAIRNGGQIYSLQSYKRKIYMGHYTQGICSIYDPWKPWKPGTTEGSNPLDIGRLSPYANRPIQVTLGKDKYIYFGTMPRYGHLGGSLVRVDPETNSIEPHRNIVKDHSIYSVASGFGVTYDETANYIYAGSSIYGGTGAKPVDKSARLLIWDTSRLEKIFECEPVPMAEYIYALAVASDGKVFGAADRTLFVFDPYKKEIETKFNPQLGTIRKLMKSANGLIYAGSDKALFQIDPKTLAISIIPTEGGVRAICEDSDHVIYLNQGPDLYKYEP